MKLKFLFLICGIFLFRISQAQTYDWVSALGASGDDVVNGIESAYIHNMDMIWVTGYSSGNFTCSAASSISQGAFVAAFDLSGNCLWAKNIKKSTGTVMINGAGNDLSYYYRTLPNGYTRESLYVTGYYDDKMFVTTFNAYNGTQELTEVYTATGESPGYDTEGNGIDVTSYGVYVTGYFTENVKFPNYPGAATGTVLNKADGAGKETFVLKLDHNLYKIFVKKIDTNYESEGRDIITVDGVSYVTGYFGDHNANDGTVKIITGHATQTITTYGYIDIFVAKFANSVLSPGQWIRNAGSSASDFNYDDTGNAISRDPSGNIYITGTITGNSTFGAYSITGSAPNAFAAKYNSSGTAQWATNLTTATGGKEGYGIISDASNSYLVGNEYFCKLTNSTGAVTSVFGIGSPAGAAAGYDIEMIGEDIYFVGEFGWSAGFTFQGTPVSAHYGSWDGYLTKLDITPRLGMENKSDSEWNCYPNPNNGSFYISSISSLEENAHHLIRVFNLSGAKVYENSITGNSTFIQLDKPNAGIYYLQITNDIGDVSNQTIEILK